MIRHPYEVCLPDHIANASDWREQASAWERLGKISGCSFESNPLTLKARYVTGVILASCLCIDDLMKEDYLVEITFYPAYMVFASAVELLGRCINGNTSTKAKNDLKAGFQWLAAPQIDTYQSIQENHILIETSPQYPYSIKALVALRNFSAHGQAALQLDIEDVDYLILEKMPLLIGNGMQAYLTELKSNEKLSAQLAHARIKPYRSRPILESCGPFQPGFPDDAALYPASIGNFLRDEMNWSCKERPLQLGDPLSGLDII